MKYLTFYDEPNDAAFTYVLLRMHKDCTLKNYLPAIFTPEEEKEVEEKLSYMSRSSEYQQLEKLARESFVKSKNSFLLFFF